MARARSYKKYVTSKIAQIYQEKLKHDQLPPIDGGIKAMDRVLFNNRANSCVILGPGSGSRNPRPNVAEQSEKSLQYEKEALKVLKNENPGHAK